jgi:hypothetical protein
VLWAQEQEAEKSIDLYKTAHIFSTVQDFCEI